MSLVHPHGLFAPSAPARRVSGFPVRMATLLTFAAVIAVLGLSSMALIAMGVPYGAKGGNLATKIHPATYLALAAVAAWMVAVGPGRVLGRLAVERAGAAAFALATVILFLHSALIVKLPLSAVIDTFLLTVFLFMALDWLDAASRDRLAAIVHTIMIANAILGIVEYGSGWRLTPMYDIDGTVMSYDWRSTAIFGHPLSNAFQTGTYLVALACGAGARMPTVIRLGAMGLSALALVAFGGRVALVLAFAMVAAIGAIGGIKVLLGRRFRLGDAIAGVTILSLAAIAVVVFVDSGGADKFLLRFSQDHGSAQTRVSMFRIFGDLDWAQFLAWPDTDLITQAQREYGLRIGVESSEVGLVASYGLLTAGLFMAALGAFMSDLVWATGKRTIWLVIYFVGVMSASTGIANKSTNLAVYTVSVFLVMPRDGAARSVTATGGVGTTVPATPVRPGPRTPVAAAPRIGRSYGWGTPTRVRPR